jgi:hypothetical protein
MGRRYEGERRMGVLIGLKHSIARGLRRRQGRHPLRITHDAMSSIHNASKEWDK